MDEKEVDLELRLAVLSEQLSIEKHVNKQLRAKIDEVFMREEAAVKALSDLKEKLKSALIESGDLKAENEALKFHLKNGISKIQQHESAADHEVCF